MKSHAAILLIGFAITTVASSAKVSAGGVDMEQCRGGLSTSLVTEAECKAYLNEHRDLELRNDREGLRNLEASFAIMLEERSEACPCVDQRARALAHSKRVLSSFPLRKLCKSH